VKQSLFKKQQLAIQGNTVISVANKEKKIMKIYGKSKQKIAKMLNYFYLLLTTPTFSQNPLTGHLLHQGETG